METPKLPALETSLYSADWQRRVPSGNQAYASASPNAAKFYQGNRIFVQKDRLGNGYMKVAIE